MAKKPKIAPTTRTRVIGTTRILEAVAKGGMAEVFRGLQKPLKREVAVKIMLPATTADPKAATRFRREALALANLHHQNIVAVHDLVEKNEQIFMIMEFVEGLDVAVLMESGPLPLDVALLVGEGVASALEHAHFRRVIHRDIKPGNVMISRLGLVKLTDFGIAKDLDYDDLTRTGMLIGTPSYIAPELLTGKKANFQTDLYALGVLLYEALTGEKPFQGNTNKELFYAISQGKRRRLRSLVPSVPRAVERLVDRCLATNPKKRWRRVSELHRELEHHVRRVLKGGTPSARLVSFLWERGHVWEDDLIVLDVDDLSFMETAATRAVLGKAEAGGKAKSGGKRVPSKGASGKGASGKGVSGQSSKSAKGSGGKMAPSRVAAAVRQGSLDRLEYVPDDPVEVGPAPVAKPKGSRKGWVAAFVVLAVLVLGGLAVWFFKPGWIQSLFR